MFQTRMTRGALALTVGALLTLTAGPASPQQGGHATHEISSDHLGQTQTVSVTLPSSYSETAELSYPVLYLLDGESNLDHASAVTAFLAETGVMPEVIVVGIHAGATRGQDYVPPASTEGATGGRADAFLSFMETELFPFIEAEYRAGPYRMVSGHSLGGLLVMYAAFLRPGLFDAHLAQSPYLDESLGTPFMEQIEARPATVGEPTRTFFFANLGDEPQLEANFHRLVMVLADGSAATRGHAVREPGASHMGTRLVGLYDGLHAHFTPLWSYDRAASTGRQGGFLAFLDSLEARFGFPVLYSESGFQQEAQALLQAGRASEAAEVSRRYVEQYPNTPVSFFLLGNSLAAGGDREGAVAAIRRAVELYESDPDPALAPLHQAMQRLLTNLGAEPGTAGGDR